MMHGLIKCWCSVMRKAHAPSQLETGFESVSGVLPSWKPVPGWSCWVAGSSHQTSGRCPREQQVREQKEEAEVEDLQPSEMAQALGVAVCKCEVGGCTVGFLHHLY
jgi:hypothetical protein